jgi:hypothetical protein
MGGAGTGILEEGPVPGKLRKPTFPRNPGCLVQSQAPPRLLVDSRTRGHAGMGIQLLTTQRPAQGHSSVFMHFSYIKSNGFISTVTSPLL